MNEDKFYWFGKLIYKLRWPIILFWLLLILCCIPFAPKLMDPFSTTGFVDPKSESAIADKELNEKLGYGYNRFIIIYQSDKLLATNPKFVDDIKYSLAGLSHFPIKHQIIYPDTNKKQISDDKHTAYAVVLFKNNLKNDKDFLTNFKSHLRIPHHLTMRVGGEPIFVEDTKLQTQRDLYKAEYVATPVAIITMLIVFGSIIAAGLPIVLGGCGAFLMLGGLYLLAHKFSLSVFTINIALLLGLCLSLDYALFIISRFRHEIKHGNNIIDAIAVTQATAGKAVFFSGLAVFVSLSALLLFPINILFSVGIGGLTAVSIAVAIAVILLPAILSILNKKINSFSIGFSSKNKLVQFKYWHWLVTKVVNYRIISFFSILAVLAVLSYPLMHVKLGISDYRILPQSLESRQVFDIFKSEFGENELTPIFILMKTPYENILSQTNINHLYDFSHLIKRDDHVDQVNGIVSTEPSLTKKQYHDVYNAPAEYLTPSVKQLLKVTTHDKFTVITVISKYPSESPQTSDLIKKIRSTNPGNKLTLEVTGSSANTVDVLKSIAHIFPYALLWIMLATYIILLILLKSLFLPLKAIITTLLSLCASYGVLVFVFQDGHFHNFLHFEPQGSLDISLMIIIFCALFGFSMDYEVFLLARIKEYYEQTGDNIKSILYGIDHSSKIITSAAIIVILVCFSFMSADIMMVKAFGLGIAVAIFVDAFLIRTILVPATMAILNHWNWYLPKWLNAILPKLTFNPKHRDFENHDDNNNSY